MTVAECFEVVTQLAQEGRIEEAESLAMWCIAYAAGVEGASQECVAQAWAEVDDWVSTPGIAYGPQLAPQFTQHILSMDSPSIVVDADGMRLWRPGEG